MYQFAFITPTYNYAHYIPRLLDSLLSQSGDDFEIIIIDDGSTDNTRETLQPYLEKYPDIMQYHYQAHLGLSAARNHGIAKARAEFLLQIDADDYLAPDALHLLRKAIEKKPDSDFFIAGYHTITPDQKKTLSLPKYLTANKTKNFVNFLRKKMSIVQGAYLIRHTVFETLHYPESISGREDLVFIAHMLALHTPTILPHPIVNIIKHQDSSRHQVQRHFGYDKIINTLFDAKILPSSLIKYQREYQSRLYLSLFRDFYLAKEYKKARKFYYNAIKINFTCLFQWKYLSKFLRSFRK